MPVLEPNEYDISYFDGDSTALKHNAGYSQYKRWYRFDGLGSTGEYWRDQAASLEGRTQIVGKKVLEIGCAKGFVVEELRDLGIDAWGLDVSSYAIGEAAPAVQSFLQVGDARTYLANYGRNEFDLVLSMRFLECVSEADLPDLIDEMSRISRYQYHTIDTQPNPNFYVVQPISWWADLKWPKNRTILVDRDNNLSETEI